MTATEELRRLLDERGVEWSATVGANGTIWTHWDAFNGQRIHAMDNEDGTVEIFDQWDLTPAQAIAATLGRGTCRNVAEPDEYSDRPFTCSECGARGPMGNGTYHMASSWAMKDGTLAFADSWPVWKYCPACGAKVVDPTTNDVDAEVEDG